MKNFLEIYERYTFEGNSTEGALTLKITINRSLLTCASKVHCSFWLWPVIDIMLSNKCRHTCGNVGLPAVDKLSPGALCLIKGE